MIKRGDIVVLNYTQEDLEPEDLGMSGIVLKSPLKQFGSRLNDDFYVIGTLKEDETFMIICLESGANDRDYLVSKNYLKLK